MSTWWKFYKQRLWTVGKFLDENINTFPWSFWCSVLLSLSLVNLGVIMEKSLRWLRVSIVKTQSPYLSSNKGRKSFWHWRLDKSLLMAPTVRASSLPTSTDRCQDNFLDWYKTLWTICPFVRRTSQDFWVVDCLPLEAPKRGNAYAGIYFYFFLPFSASIRLCQEIVKKKERKDFTGNYFFRLLSCLSFLFFRACSSSLSSWETWRVPQITKGARDFFSSWMLF